jgi:vitamin B12 transporter
LKKSAIAALLVAFATSPAIAQSPDQEVVVTATRLPQPQSQTLQPVTIITARDIASAGQQTLVEVLQALGGVEITSNGGYGQTSGVFIRGANSNQTLVLVDGMRINSATTGTTAFENIPLDQIQRIEVVAGPMSGLYGSDAIGGVIQIFTKSGQYAPTTNVSAGAGTYGTYSASAAINRAAGATEFSVSGGYFYTMGFDATKPSIPFDQHNPDKDGYRNTNFSAKLAQHLDGNNELGITAFQSDGFTHFDASPTTDDINHEILSAYSVYSRNRVDAWESLLKAGESTDDSTVSGAFPGFFRTRQPQVTWQNNIKLGPGTAIAGLEYLQQRVDSDTAYAQTSRIINSAFAGYLGELGSHAWQVNVRQDDNSQFGNHTTGLLGYAYRVIPDLRVRASVATGFKAPTFNDLYFPGFSNPNLQPERSLNRELGLSYQAGSDSFNATYFDNHITDLIVLDQNFVPQNLGQARIDGLELGYYAVLGGYRLSAKATVQNPVDEATGQMLPRRAKEFGSLSLNRTSGSWTLGAEVVASSARFDQAGEAEGSRMHGYALLNLTAVYALGPEWSIRARWNNVFDSEYELAQNYNTPGSNVFVAVQYQPK